MFVERCRRWRYRESVPEALVSVLFSTRRAQLLTPTASRSRISLGVWTSHISRLWSAAMPHLVFLMSRRRGSTNTDTTTTLSHRPFRSSSQRERAVYMLIANLF